MRYFFDKYIMYISPKAANFQFAISCDVWYFVSWVPEKCETKQKRNETKQIETKQMETKRNKSK